MIYQILFPFNRLVQFNTVDFQWIATDDRLQTQLQKNFTESRVMQRMQGAEFELPLLDVAVQQVCRIYGANILVRPGSTTSSTELAIGILEAAGKKVAKEEIGPPPFEGAVFDRNKHRWVKPAGSGTDDDPLELVKAGDDEQLGLVGRQKERLKARVAKLPGGKHVLKGGEVAMKVFHVVEKPLMLAQRKTQELAVEAAKLRGLDEVKAKQLGRILAIADFAGGYATGGIALAVAGPLAGKAASFLPSVSVAYLAYSTARDPVATLKAAKEVMAKTFGRGSKQESMNNFPDAMAEFLGTLSTEQADWFEALFAVALVEADGDADEAFQLAQQAYQDNPTNPTEPTV